MHDFLSFQGDNVEYNISNRKYMKRRIEQSFHDCDQYVQLDMMPEQRYQIVTCSKTDKYERDDFIAICQA